MTNDHHLTTVPIDQISIGQSQIRTEPDPQKIEELANNIARNGLINPITLRKVGHDQYEVIAGQMRYLACQKLGHATVSATVIDEVDDLEAKSLSLIENLLRSDPAEKEYIDACIDLYKRYGSTKAVAQELKIKEAHVRKYIKYPRLPDALKEIVDNQNLDINYAVQIADACTDEEGHVDAERAARLAEKMLEYGGGQQKNIAETAKRMKGASVDEIVNKSQEAKKVKKVTLQLSDEQYSGLQSYAQEHNTKAEEAALQLVAEGLTSRGFVDEG